LGGSFGTSDCACILPSFFALEGSMDHLLRAVMSATMFLLVASSHATAQETCLLYQRGTVDCPAYGAPAATAVPGPSMDGGVAQVPSAQSTTLFGGKVPPNGFFIRVYAGNGYGPPAICFVNDNGPAGLGIGFYIPGDVPGNVSFPSATFASPHGYKPIGPVSIWCQTTGPFNLAARGW
jgi:hypothetical protein